MKKTLLLLFIFYSSFLQGQNLVLNPSFEDTLQDWSSQNYAICKNWYNPNGADADYYSPYSYDLGWGFGMTTPSNIVGYQITRTGVAYTGIDVYEPDTSISDYLQGFLSSPLIKDSVYYVCLYVNMADSSDYSICSIEVGFTDTLLYNNTTQGPIPIVDTIRLNASNVDTTNWFLLQGYYLAKGGEKYIYIGNNLPTREYDSCVVKLNNKPLYQCWSYYLIDDVSVTLNNQNGVLNYTEDKKVNIFPNPANNYLSVEIIDNTNDYYIMTLFNIIGEEKLTLKTISTKTTINTTEFDNGIYFLKIRNGKNEITRKIIINH